MVGFQVREAANQFGGHEQYAQHADKTHPWNLGKPGMFCREWGAAF